jgi:hypothetical protein
MRRLWAIMLRQMAMLKEHEAYADYFAYVMMGNQTKHLQTEK